MERAATVVAPPRRARLHRRLVAVAVLLAAVTVTTAWSAAATRQGLVGDLADARTATGDHRAAVGLRSRFLESRRAIDQLLAALPLDPATLADGPFAESYRLIQTVTSEWSVVSRRTDGALRPMPSFLDVDAEAITAFMAGAGHDDPRVARLRVDVDASYEARRAELEVLIDDVAARADAALASAGRRSAAGHRRTLLVLGGGSFAGLVLAGLMARTAARQHRQAVGEDRARREAAVVVRQEQEIQNGLDMARTEEGVLRVVQRAVDAHVPGVRVEVLLADSSRSHFARPLVAGGVVAGGCTAVTPEECPALARGHRLDFADNGAVDACPHLPPPSAGACRATCIPMSIAGSAAGVLHVVAPTEGASLDVPLLETMARSGADRIGVLRAFARSEAQAATDPLTGLLNRRSLEDRARRHLDGDLRCTAAFGDLDHFKRLNDIHGHDTGDRALRLFARVLAEEVRPGDLVARFGGEEFVLLLVDCDAADALNVLHRVHDRLAHEVAVAGLPVFTASFGVAEWDGDASLADLLARADMALLQAKRDGRDCDRTYVRGQVAALADPASGG